MITTLWYTPGSTYIPARDIETLLQITDDTRLAWANNGFLTPQQSGSQSYHVTTVNDFLARQASGFSKPPTVDDLATGHVRLLTVPEVRHKLSIPRHTISRLLRGGHLAGIKLRTTWRVCEESAYAYATGLTINADFTLEEAARILSRSVVTVRVLGRRGHLQQRLVRTRGQPPKLYVTRQSLLGLLKAHLPVWIDPEDWLQDRRENPEPHLTKMDACKRLGVSSAALDLLVATRQLQTIRNLGCSHYQVAALSVRAYIDHNSKPLTQKQVACLYGVHRRTVIKWWRKKLVSCPIPGHYHPHGSRLFGACWIAILATDCKPGFRPVRWYTARLVKKSSYGRTLTADDVSKVLGVNQNQVNVLADSGAILAIRTPGGTWRFSEPMVARAQTIILGECGQNRKSG